MPLADSEALERQRKLVKLRKENPPTKTVIIAKHLGKGVSQGTKALYKRMK